jgi:hypothetical protein
MIIKAFIKFCYFYLKKIKTTQYDIGDLFHNTFIQWSPAAPKDFKASHHTDLALAFSPSSDVKVASQSDRKRHENFCARESKIPEQNLNPAKWGPPRK